MSLTGASAVVAGAYHSLAVKGDGTLWVWGDNFRGQLGDGTTTSRLTPVQVRGLTGVAAAAAGTDHSLALRTDGTVWAWGSNRSGQLGDGTTAARLTPLQVPDITDMVAIAAAGGGSSMALKRDGTVWIWGGSTSYSSSSYSAPATGRPVMLSGITGVRAVVAAGGYGSGLALKSDGTVWVWSPSSSGLSLQQVSGLSGITAIAAGQASSLALKNDGTVWAWGISGSSYGYPYGGGSPYGGTPQQVSGLTGVAAIAAGGAQILARKTDGTVWAWSSYGSGPYGCYPGATSGCSPQQVSGLSGVTAIAAGASHSLAVIAGPPPPPMPTPPPNASPTPSTSAGGRNFTLTSLGGRAVGLTWESGTGQTRYSLARFSPSAPMLVEIESLGPTETSAVDQPPGPDNTFCYRLRVMRGADLLAISDFLCTMLGVAGGDSPQRFAIRLGQTQHATLNWRPVANATDYVVVPLGSQRMQVVGPSETSASDSMGGVLTCYMVFARRGQAPVGWTNAMCGLPGFSTLGPGVGKHPSGPELKFEGIAPAR